MCTKLDESAMESKRRKIINDLICELIQKVNILEYYGIMKRFNVLGIGHTKLYFNNNCSY